MKFETVILRFRDLGLENGETIDRHKKIIENEGYVWWAWWNKGNEQIPIEEMSVLRTCAEDDDKIFEVYLLDSGLRRLYRAGCKEVRFKKNKFMESPEKEKTPEYYKDRKYLAWFKFVCIEECSSEDISKFSYVQVNEIFVDTNIDYGIFTDKRICNLKELIQQDRSMWFVREYKEKDLEHEIVLLNAKITEPKDFSKHFYEMTGDSILWLSDLHFDDELSYMVGKKDNIDSSTLAEHIEKCTSFNNVCGLLISGDITNCGKERGFQIARQFVKDITEKNKNISPVDSIIFCPGNHDFARINSNLGKHTPELLVDHIESAKGYSDFYHDTYGKYPNQFFSCGRKFLMSCGRTVEIAALNSVILQQYKDFEGHGFLCQEQLEFVADNMGWNSEKRTNTIRIAVMHHHYLPTCLVEKIDTQKASSIVYDAERLMEWMKKYNVRILLHGHKHRNFYASVATPVQTTKDRITFVNEKQTYIIGMGSTLVSGCDNRYAVIHIMSDTIEIDFYRIYLDSSQSDYKEQTLVIPI